MSIGVIEPFGPVEPTILPSTATLAPAGMVWSAMRPVVARGAVLTVSRTLTGVGLAAGVATRMGTFV